MFSTEDIFIVADWYVMSGVISLLSAFLSLSSHDTTRVIDDGQSMTLSLVSNLIIRDQAYFLAASYTFITPLCNRPSETLPSGLIQFTQ